MGCWAAPTQVQVFTWTHGDSASLQVCLTPALLGPALLFRGTPPRPAPPHPLQRQLCPVASRLNFTRTWCEGTLIGHDPSQVSKICESRRTLWEPELLTPQLVEDVSPVNPPWMRGEPCCCPAPFTIWWWGPSPGHKSPPAG
ncbi:hypothetical protein HJG60_009180 [Phyllostomus discolor]|uniref:Uncharacterized protein n=1 Tax=Phyllostomus discolor TaxID=89673 RepID=A0A833YQ12_9CHIR|nr:hypothetical protein HJG60_009180 [Phyllostomus discolor]